jgi:hypothetical protein
MKILLPIVALFGLGACATTGISVSQNAAAGQRISEASAVTRGRPREYRPPVTIENAQVFDAASFQEFRSQFLVPLTEGPWRYVVDGITLDADSEEDREWTLLIALDTGARVKVENFGAWDEITHSHFRGGYQQALRGLQLARAQDRALDRYARFWFSKRPHFEVAAAVSEPVAAE